MKRFLERIKYYLSKLSFRTGVIILALCVLCYILSFAQMLLPISATAKSVLWFVLFGMAKTTQYAGLAIIGVEGWRRVKGWFKRVSNEE
ncbi:MAG: hypothetical protein IJX40_00335 [Alistipes sp.]|nr:hypothetical protein [Alistipes sp.]